MLFNRTLALSCLLASAVLAYRPGEQRQSLSLNHVERSTDQSVVYNTVWAGAARTEAPGTFHYIEGIFVVPHISGPNNTSGAAVIAIDGPTCRTTILGTGIYLAPGVPPQARYEWYPDPSQPYPDFPIAPGDRIKLSVTAYSATRALTKVINLSTGRYAKQYLSSSHALCMQDAEWIIEDFSSGDDAINFGTIAFEDAKAKDHSGKTYGPAGGTLYDTKRNGKLLTTTSINGDTITIKRD